MADVPNWAMSSAAGKTMREISALIEEMKGCGIVFPSGGFQRKQDAIAFIEEQRGKFWKGRPIADHGGGVQRVPAEPAASAALR